jgi:putative transposase
VTTDTGKLELEIPRDRQSSFDPQLIARELWLKVGDAA